MDVGGRLMEKWKQGALRCLYSCVSPSFLLLRRPVSSIPFAEEIEDSSQAYHQQNDTDDDESHLILSHWLRHQQQLLTPLTVEARLTFARLCVYVHKKHALAIVEAVVVKRRVTTLYRPLLHMRALFPPICRDDIPSGLFRGGAEGLHLGPKQEDIHKWDQHREVVVPHYGRAAVGRRWSLVELCAVDPRALNKRGWTCELLTPIS